MPIERSRSSRKRSEARRAERLGKNEVLSGRNGPARPTAAGRSRPSRSLPSFAGPTRQTGRDRVQSVTDATNTNTKHKHNLCFCLRCTLLCVGTFVVLRLLIVRARLIKETDTRPRQPFSRREIARGLARAFLPRAASSAPPSPRDTRGYHPPSRRFAAAAALRAASASRFLGTPPSGSCPDVSLFFCTGGGLSLVVPGSSFASRADGCCREPARIRVGPPGHHVCGHVAFSGATASLTVTADGSRSLRLLFLPTVR